jgi:HSP20 family protein
MSSLLPSLWGGSDNNGAPLHSLHREFDKVFSEFSRNFGLPSLAPTNGKPGALFSPSINVIEKDKALEITTELPGVSEKDVEVTIADNMLTIQGEKKPKKKKRKTTTAWSSVHTARSSDHCVCPSRLLPTRSMPNSKTAS